MWKLKKWDVCVLWSLTCCDEIKDTDAERGPVMESEVDKDPGRMMLHVTSEQRRVVRVEELVGGEQERRQGVRNPGVDQWLVMSSV